MSVRKIAQDAHNAEYNTIEKSTYVALVPHVYHDAAGLSTYPELTCMLESTYITMPAPIPIYISLVDRSYTHIPTCLSASVKTVPTTPPSPSTKVEHEKPQSLTRVCKVSVSFRNEHRFLDQYKRPP